jgi:hypothetical protein
MGIMDKIEEGQGTANRAVSIIDWIRWFIDWLKGLFIKE